MAPLYLKELIVPYQPTRALRSQNSGLLVVPKVSKSRVGARAFSYQAPLLWNHLPLSVREADTICTFKSRLKTFLYVKAYSLSTRMSGDTGHTELLFPVSPSSSQSWSHERNEYLINTCYWLDFFPGVPLPYRPQIQGHGCDHILDYDGGSRIRDRDNNGGSCIVLASDSGGGPRSRWQLMMDPYGGTGQWLWTIVASDLDGGSSSWWLLTIDYDCSRTAWYTIFLLRYSTITDNNPSIHWPSVMLQNVYSNQCC